MTVVILHKILISVGFLSALGILLSVLLLIAERKILNYGICTININNGKRNLEVKGGSSLLLSLSENNIYIPSACGGQGSCGLCKVRVPEGGGMIGPVELPYLSTEETEDNVRLSCQVKVRNDLMIEIPEELFLVKLFSAKVISKRNLTHDIVGLRLELIAPEKIDYMAGQFVQLNSEVYKGRESIMRAYSISSLPSDNGHIELMIRKVPEGICTTWVFDYMQEGSEITFSGPYGKFCLSDTEAPMIFIAGGSGMAPIYSMLRHMKETGNNRKAIYFFGAATQRDLFLMDEMSRLQEDMENFKFVPALSHEPPDTDWKGERGWITDIVKNTIPDISGYEAYLCGSPGMLNACIEVLTGGGMPEEKIYYDKFA